MNTTIISTLLSPLTYNNVLKCSQLYILSGVPVFSTKGLRTLLRVSVICSKICYLVSAMLLYFKGMTIERHDIQLVGLDRKK